MIEINKTEIEKLINELYSIWLNHNDRYIDCFIDYLYNLIPDLLNDITLGYSATNNNYYII